MAAILGIATALPEHRLSPADTKESLARVYPERIARRFARLVDRSGIGNRCTVLPLDETLACTTIAARNVAYAENAIALATAAARDAIAASDVPRADIGTVICVSCTGYMLPSLESHLIAALDLGRHARRLPVGGLGCSAGVAAVGLGAQLHRPGAGGAVLVVSVELCSLCLQSEEPSVDDVLGSILFADGAGAVVIGAGGERCAELVAQRSVLWPGTGDKLGMHLSHTGFRLVLSSDIARLLRPRLRPSVDEFLAASGVGLSELDFFVLHPGGPRILEAIADGLELPDSAVRTSAEVLEQHGNLSSATVFAILERVIATCPPKAGSLGLMLAIGPGLSCELALLRWRGAGPRVG
jgi:alkylresorcinol/alkylpyrone synthase